MQKSYYRLCDVTSWGAPEYHVEIPDEHADIMAALEEKLYGLFSINATDDVIFENLGAEPMPDDYRTVDEDEYEGYLVLDCGYGIKSFFMPK